MSEAINAVLESRQGEFVLVGQLAARGNVSVCGLDASGWFTFAELGDGRHDVHLAYEWSEEHGATVAAVALLAAGAGPRAVADAEWEEVSDDVNELSEHAAAISSSTPGNLSIDRALHRTPGFARAGDPVAHAVAAFRAQQDAGSRTPLLDVLVDEERGANALVFPTRAFTSNSILIGRSADGAGVGIVWSQFGD